MLTAQNSKRLQTTQAQLQEISYAQEHNQLTSFNTLLSSKLKG